MIACMDKRIVGGQWRECVLSVGHEGRHSTVRGGVVGYYWDSEDAVETGRWSTGRPQDQTIPRPGMQIFQRDAPNVCGAEVEGEVCQLTQGHEGEHWSLLVMAGVPETSRGVTGTDDGLIGGVYDIPERDSMAAARADAARIAELFDENAALEEQAEHLRRRMQDMVRDHEVQKAFYDLAIAQRNYAWREVEQLRVIVEKVRTES